MFPMHFKVAEVTSLSSHTKIKPNNIEQILSSYFTCNQLIGGAKIKDERDVDLHLPNAIVSPHDNLS
jgi:hypothetical protein